MTPRRVAEAGGTGGRVGLTALLLVGAAVGMLLLVRAQPDPEPAPKPTPCLKIAPK